MRKIMRILFVLLVIAVGYILYKDYKGKEGIRFVASMGSGINIGNTLDSTRVRERKKDASVEYYETYWNNPPITKELFSMIQEAGFATVRIPVSWDEHMDENGKLDDRWLDRVEEVVAYGIQEGLYVILDTHHESWLVPLPEKEVETKKKLIVLWEQIAGRFADYPEQLLFEGMNEPRTIGSEAEWRGGTKEERKVVNRLNSAFVETVRGMGGKNTQRWLIITSYGGNHEDVALTELEIPKDDKIIVTIHAYLPYDFTQNNHGTSVWSKQNKKDSEPVKKLMEMLHQSFIKNNIPVILTEFGCIDKENSKERLAWTQYYTEQAKKNNIGYIWWDNGGDYSLMNREDYSWKEEEIVEILTR